MSDVDNTENSVMQQFTVQDMVNYAMAKDAANLSTAFNSVIGSKVLDAIQQKKIDIAKKIMNPESGNDQEEGDTESDDTVQATSVETDSVENETSDEILTNGEENDEVAQQNT